MNIWLDLNLWGNLIRMFATRPLHICLLLTILMSVICCRRHREPGTAAERRFGIHVSLASQHEYPQDFAIAHNLGMTCVPLTLQWTALEADGRYDTSQFLPAANQFYKEQKVSLSLCLSPFVADRRDFPRDLSALPFDDPAVITRFIDLVDTILNGLNNVRIRYLLIGNESDLYFALHASEIIAYQRFCQAIKNHVHARSAEVEVSVETTLDAAIGPQAGQIAQLHENMDLVALTYYPLAPDFTMDSPERVLDDVPNALAKYKGRKVILQECGYATGSLCKGSEDAQAKFINLVFDVWDNHAIQMPFVSFLWLHDLSQEQAAELTDIYGITGTSVAPAFTDYLRTLGLRDYQSNPKKAFESLASSLAKREWAP